MRFSCVVHLAEATRLQQQFLEIFTQQFIMEHIYITIPWHLMHFFMPFVFYTVKHHLTAAGECSSVHSHFHIGHCSLIMCCSSSNGNWIYLHTPSSVAFTSASRSNNIWTTCSCPSEAASCNAVRPYYPILHYKTSITVGLSVRKTKLSQHVPSQKTVL